MSSMSRAERREWSAEVLAQLDLGLGSLLSTEVEIHAGQDYWRWGLLEGLQQRGAQISLPLKHKGIGEQLSWYAKQRAGDA